MDISSASNRQVTLLRKLNRKKHRQQEQLFLLEGARAVEQVFENKAIKVQALFFDADQQYWHQEQWQKLAQQVDVFTLAADLFAEVTDTDTPQGVLALCQIPSETTVDKLASQNGIIVALDAVQDPGNVGTIIRTATWFGITGLFSGKGTVDLFHPKVVRGTAGATGIIPHINGDLMEILPKFERADWPIFLLDADQESQSISKITSIDKAIIVVGNEAHGIDSALITEQRRKVRIPAPIDQTGVESLNAAVATSISLYDFSEKFGHHTD